MTEMIARVFPRKTSYTPEDEFVFFSEPPLFLPNVKEVHISCTFTWDKSKAEYLAKQWSKYYSIVKLGGPAYDDFGGEFIPGLYLKYGEIITSRGCPNCCSYCFVPQREGNLRLLKIKEGWDILDNNLTACPKEHIKAVFDMFSKQNHKISFRGGLEARRIDDFFIQQLNRIDIKAIWIAYDRQNEKDAVKNAIKKLQKAGYSQRQICCYVLVGYINDEPKKAIERLEWILQIGAMPFAMYYRGQITSKEIPPDQWQKIVRPYSRPRFIFAKEHLCPK